MIQFNLLPDVKLEYIKARRTKRLLATVSVIAAAASVFIAILTFVGVNIVQRARMESLNKDINKTAKLVQATPNISRIITVQNQLSSLPALHEAKPAATRVYDYIAQITPATVTISKATISFTDNTINITGNAKDLLGVNTLVDTLKFTSYKVKDQTGTPKAFNKVVLASFSTASSGGGDSKGASYEIALNYDPPIFDNKSTVELQVPQTITTRSQIGSLDALLQSNPIKEGPK